jgi:hypothetical protein
VNRTRTVVFLLALSAGFMLGRGTSGRSDRANLVIALGTVVLAAAAWMEFRSREATEERQHQGSRARLIATAGLAAGQVEALLDLQGAGHADPDWMSAVLKRRAEIEDSLREVVHWAAETAPAYAAGANAALVALTNGFDRIEDVWGERSAESRRYANQTPSQLCTEAVKQFRICIGELR